MRGKITVTLKAVEIYLAFRPPPPPSIYNTFPRACDISREGGSKWLERGSKVGYVKKGRRVRAIYDIYLWTRLRDRNPEVVKVGFVTYFPSPPDVEIPIDWRTGVSQFPSRSPDWRGWKQRFTSGKGQNRSRWICIYVWYIAKGGEGASWACSERFSLAFHGMRSCFKILVNLASLSLYICIYIYIRILHTYIDLPIFRAACLFANANLEEIDFFPPSLSFLSLSFSWLLSFLLITQFIFILQKIYDNWRFPLSPVHGGISDFLIFSFFLSFFFAVYRRRRVPSSMAEKCFHRNQPPGVYLADRHSFESLFSGAAPPFGRCCICRGATRSPPRQDGRAPGRIRGNFPRTQSWISCFSVFMHFYWSYFIDRAKLCIVARRGKLIWELLSIDRNSIEIIFNYPRIPSFEILLRTWPSGQRQVRCVMYLCP